MVKRTLGPRPQSGAALVVGLLLLLVLTLLAISGMNTASLELVMAGNMQYQENAFQAAEAGIEQALVAGEFNPGNPLGDRIPELPAASEAIPGTDGRDTFVAVILRQNNGQPLEALYGSSWNSFSTYHFEIQSAGQSARGARASNTQGMAQIAQRDDTQGPASGLPTELTP